MKKNNNELLIFSPSIEDGGVEKNLYNITNFLSRKINKVTVVTANKDKNNFYQNVNFISPKNDRWNKSSRIIKSIICVLISIRYYLKTNQKIILLSFNNNIFAIILGKILKMKVIIRCNTSLESYLTNFIKKIFFKIFYSWSDKIIVNSYVMKKEFKNLGINAICIYNPLEDLNHIKQKSKSKIQNLFFKDNCLNILTVGRLVKQKDQITLLKSLKYVHPSINYKLLIIGDGEKKKDLAKYIKDQNLEKKVKIIKYQNNIYPFFKHSDIFTLTSLNEGLPNVLIECLALKKIIISTNCKSGPSEILKNGKFGKLIKVGDFKKLGKTITDINYRRNYYNNIAKRGFKSLNRFDYQLNCKKYLHIINKLL